MSREFCRVSLRSCSSNSASAVATRWARRAMLSRLASVRIACACGAPSRRAEPPLVRGPPGTPRAHRPRAPGVGQSLDRLLNVLELLRGGRVHSLIPRPVVADVSIQPRRRRRQRDTFLAVLGRYPAPCRHHRLSRPPTSTWHRSGPQRSSSSSPLHVPRKVDRKVQPRIVWSACRPPGGFPAEAACPTTPLSASPAPTSTRAPASGSPRP